GVAHHALLFAQLAFEVERVFPVEGGLLALRCCRPMPARLGGLRHGGTPGLADAFFPPRRRLAISPAFAEELAFHAHVHLLNSRASPIGARRTGSRLPLPHFARPRQKRGRGQSLSRPSRNCRAGSDRLMTYLPAPVAQLDRALPSEGRGREFESRRARQRLQRLIRYCSALVNGLATI